MKVNALTRAAFGFIDKVKPDATTLLTVAGCVGVAGTALTTYQATTKADALLNGQSVYSKKEVLKRTWKCYIPPVLIGVSTMACVLSANHLNKKRQAAITSAYVALDQLYKDFKRRVATTYGEEAVTDIIKKRMSEDYESELIELGEDDGKVLYYDEYSDRYFRTTPKEFTDACNFLNRLFDVRGKVNLNDFYRLLGLETVPEGNLFGWNWDYIYEEDCAVGTAYIDIEASNYFDDISGLESAIVIFVTQPRGDYNETM